MRTSCEHPRRCYPWWCLERIHARSRNVSNALGAARPSHKPLTEVKMAKDPKVSSDDRLKHPLLDEKFREISAAAGGQGIFVYSVKIVCGKQTETNCCCVAGARPGLY